MVNANLLLGLAATVAVTSTLLSVVALLWVTSRRRNLPDFTPPVTIYKPLKGIDEGLEDNLRSFFRLDYPTFQLLFCVADADDPAIAVVDRLLARVPRTRTPGSSSAARRSGSTRKSRAWRRWTVTASTTTILISDSNVRVRPSYLRGTACYLAEPGVGLVTNLFVGRGRGPDRAPSWRT